MMSESKYLSKFCKLSLYFNFSYFFFGFSSSFIFGFVFFIFFVIFVGSSLIAYYFNGLNKFLVF